MRCNPPLLADAKAAREGGIVQEAKDQADGLESGNRARRVGVPIAALAVVAETSSFLTAQIADVGWL